MKAILTPLIFLTALLGNACAQPSAKDNIQFDHLAKKWDEAMPLGNGMLGALIWEKDSRLRLSLDRADLWDERQAFDVSRFDINWVRRHVLANDYDTVSKLGDAPYDNIAWPTKLPAAAIEFDIHSMGKVVSNVLDIGTALNTIKFENGAVFHCYIHATREVGYFGFENLPASADIMTLLQPHLIIPDYTGEHKVDDDNSHSGGGLEALGYTKGTVVQSGHSIRYHQPTSNGHYYEVSIEWHKIATDHVIGKWVITNDAPAATAPLNTRLSEPTGWNEHARWWMDFWSRSGVNLPDPALQRQYCLEMYKLGCVARKNAPVITLQAVWTADNGNLPPWKGDVHNDLNTQLSYWPAYTGNHLQEAGTYTDWLWKTKRNNEQYTKTYFKTNGLAVPGVETIHGYAMGGWIQYSLSPTVAAWCAQHFYWQWKYSMDTVFLKTRAYPYIHAVATFLENISFLKDGVRKLPLNTSPEYHDNRVTAFFSDWTNYDLSLAKFLFTAAATVSEASGKAEEARHWQKILAQLPGYDVNETGLTIAPGQNLDESHRHLANYMAIYPLDLLDIDKPADRAVIQRSLQRIVQKGTMAWCGYSFPWMACLYARAREADSAVRQLQIFSSNFCSTNSFHLNGDQKGGQYSDFTYRPFTLEGNFAFAQGVHELLLQSRNGYIEVFPAIPDTWQHVGFKNLRAEGAFLVSAEKNGNDMEVVVTSLAGGLCRLRVPFRKELVILQMKKGEKRTLRAEHGGL